jgi:hypothetical protein
MAADVEAWGSSAVSSVGPHSPSGRGASWRHGRTGSEEKVGGESERRGADGGGRPQVVESGRERL